MTVSRWVIMQKARRQPGLASIGLRLLVGDGFQDLFHSPPGVLFSVRSRYSFTIGLSGVFSLRVWSPQIHAGFHESGVTQVPTWADFATRTGLSPSLGSLSSVFHSRPQSRYCRPYNPAEQAPRFGLWRFRSPLLTPSHAISLPRATKMFQFTRLAPTLRSVMWVLHMGLPHSDIRGSQVRCTYPRLFAA